MLTDTFFEVIRHEGVVAIVSCANNEAHVVNTWNTYLHITDDERILLPAWAMRKTEKNITQNNQILLTVGTKEVQGKMGAGTGFLVKGTARFVASGPEWEMMKEKFPFLTRVLEITVTSIKQTI